MMIFRPGLRLSSCRRREITGMPYTGRALAGLDSVLGRFHPIWMMPRCRRADNTVLGSTTGTNTA